jgi:hypothetical protein
MFVRFSFSLRLRMTRDRNCQKSVGFRSTIGRGLMIDLCMSQARLTIQENPTGLITRQKPVGFRSTIGRGLMIDLCMSRARLAV